MSAVERIPHFTASVYPQLVSVMGLNATLEDAVVARSGQDEEHRLGDVLGRHHPGELRHVGRPAVALFHREVGRDAAGTDVGAAHALGAELVVERPREGRPARTWRRSRRASNGSPRRPASDATETKSPPPRAIRCGNRRRGRRDHALCVDVHHLVEMGGVRSTNGP